MSVFSHVCSADQARNAEKKAIEMVGIPSLVLMENAAKGIGEFIEGLQGIQRVAIVCGPGNNGADGLTLARILNSHGKKVQVYIDMENISETTAGYLDVISQLNVPIYQLEEFEPNADLLVDAMFGTGLNKPLPKSYALVAELINTAKLPVLAIDIPSGIDPNNGRLLGQSGVRAHWTIALDTLKWGHLLQEGRVRSGKVIVKDIGLPSFLHDGDGSVPVLDEEMAKRMLPKRTRFGNKATFGNALLAGGSFRMQGALCMAAQACFHCGCGTMTIFAPKPAAKLLASKMELAMTLPAFANPAGFFKEGAGNKELLASRIEPFSVVGCGNGMGQGLGAKEVLEAVLEGPQPVVLDADALNLLGHFPELWQGVDKTVVLTPHIKEFCRLTGKTLKEVLDHPLALAKEFIHDHPNAILVLKADWTIVCSAKRVAVLNRPDDALSKGGSGDVLAGMITGLLSMRMDPFNAAALGVYLHNQAATYRQSTFSFTPLDLIQNLGLAFESLEAAKKAMKPSIESK